MKFNSNSVLLNGGCQVKFDVYIPSFLLEFNISDEIWQKAIDNFNELLNNRENVTTTINDVRVDILKVESVEESKEFLKMGAVILRIAIDEEDLPKIKDIQFCMTGYLTFDRKSASIDKMVIKNITYGGIDHKKFNILNDSN